MSAVYERFLVPAVFQPFAVDMAERVAATGSERVLELAAGSGVVTRELAGVLSGAEVTATDLNDAMVDLGRRLVPGATWRRADALALPFDDDSFDAVVCQFGVMFFPDKPGAFAEMARVLEPGGHAIVSSWDTLATHEFAAALTGGLERAFPDDPPRFVASIPHGYNDPDALVADATAGGLRPLSVERITLEGRSDSAADVAAGFCAGTPLRAEIEERGDLRATTALVAREMEARLGSGPVMGRMAAHVLTATPAGTFIPGG
jgi:SAM-dependent methyltransferase